MRPSQTSMRKRRSAVKRPSSPSGSSASSSELTATVRTGLAPASETVTDGCETLTFVAPVTSQVVDSVSSMRSSRFVPSPDAEAPFAFDATFGSSAKERVTAFPAATVSVNRRRP